jgi:hypothetical protein
VRDQPGNVARLHVVDREGFRALLFMQWAIENQQP